MSYPEMSCNEVLSYNEMSCYKMFWNVMILHMYFLMCRNKYLTISIDVLYLVFIYLILCIQARIFLSYSSQCETSEMRVSIERPHKKTIIMRIHSIMHIRSSSLDQEADTVWVMSLNFTHLFVMHIRIYSAYSHACAKQQEIPIMHL